MSHRAFGFIAVLSIAFSLGCAPKNKPLAAGDHAPEFSLIGSDGKAHRLSDYQGTFVVLAWFPKANTGG